MKYLLLLLPFCTFAQEYTTVSNESFMHITVTMYEIKEDTSVSNLLSFSYRNNKYRSIVDVAVISMFDEEEVKEFVDNMDKAMVAREQKKQKIFAYDQYTFSTYGSFKEVFIDRKGKTTYITPKQWKKIRPYLLKMTFLP